MKRVLVTGSSRGIGRAIALALARDGWNVAVHCRNRKEEAALTVSDLGAQAGGLYDADLGLPEEAERLWNDVRRDGPIHALVNNAGSYQPCRVLETPDEEWFGVWQQTFALNLDSPMRLTRLAALEFAKLGGGRIVNVASRVGFRGEAGAAAYAASKAGLINLTRSLAVELAPVQVLLFGLAPGWVDTAMAREGMDDRLPTILEGIPLGRMARPEDCAEVAAFFLSGRADYLSGQTIDINGASYFH